MSDMIKFINTQNHSQNPRIDLKIQTIRIQQEILHSHDDKTFIISPRLLTAIYNDNLLKRGKTAPTTARTSKMASAPS